MTVAIIGYPGAGKSTLAMGLRGLLGGRTARHLKTAWDPSDDGGPVFLDGIPQNLADLDELIATSPDGNGVDRYVYLDVPLSLRIPRIARMVSAGLAEPAHARDRMLHPAEFALLLQSLEASGKLITIDARGSRSEIVNRVLDALDIRI